MQGRFQTLVRWGLALLCRGKLLWWGQVTLFVQGFALAGQQEYFLLSYFGLLCLQDSLNMGLSALNDHRLRLRQFLSDRFKPLFRALTSFLIRSLLPQLRQFVFFLPLPHLLPLNERCSHGPSCLVQNWFERALGHLLSQLFQLP